MRKGAEQHLWVQLFWPSLQRVPWAPTERGAVSSPKRGSGADWVWKQKRQKEQKCLGSVGSRGELQDFWSGPAEKIHSQRRNISGSGWMADVFSFLITPHAAVGYVN